MEKYFLTKSMPKLLGKNIFQDIFEKIIYLNSKPEVLKNIFCKKFGDNYLIKNLRKKF